MKKKIAVTRKGKYVDPEINSYSTKKLTKEWSFEVFGRPAVYIFRPPDVHIIDRAIR